MSDAEEALRRVKEIAAQLNLGAGVHNNTDLGKRKASDSTYGPGGSDEPRKKKKVYVPVAEHPDVNFSGILIGPKGSTIKHLQEISGAIIKLKGKGLPKKDGQSIDADDEDDLHVSIEGTDEQIDRAMVEVEKILFNPQEAMKLKASQLHDLAEMSAASGSRQLESHNSGINDSGNGESFEMELKVPNHLVGYIIGKGGDVIQRIQIQSGAHLQVQKESEMKPGETHRHLTLKGSSQESIDDLKRRIDDIVNPRMGLSSSGNMVATASMGGGQQELTHAFVIKIPIPNEKIGMIIGKAGVNVKGIQERTRAKLLIPPTPDEDNQSTRTISIGADYKEWADAAQMEIFLILQQGQQQVQQAQMTGNIMFISVPDERIGIIIGKQGSTIKDIQARAQIKIIIPQTADPGTNPPIRTLSLIGCPEGQHFARFEIEMILQGSLQGSTSAAAAAAAAATIAAMQQAGYGPYAPSHQAAASAASYGQQYASHYAPATAASAYGSQYMSMYGQQQQHAAQYGQYYDPNAAYSQAYGVAATSKGQTAEVAPTDPTAYYDAFWQYAAYYGEAAARAYYTAWSPPVGTAPPAGVVIPADPAASAAASASVVASDTSADANSEKTKAWGEYEKQYREWYEAHGKAIGADPNPPKQ